MNLKSLFLSFCIMGLPCLGWADFYQVQDISVQASADSAKVAKSQALEEAQQKAFSTLMRRMAGEQNPFVDHLPDTTEIVSFVQDLSLKNEKNTSTDYWADVDVQFKKQAVEDFLTQKKVAFLKKVPETLLVIPVLKTPNGWLGVEEKNPLNQFLNNKNQLSEFYDLKLLSGDLDEIVAVNQYFKSGDISQLNEFLSRYEAKGILMVQAEQMGADNWRLTGTTFIADVSPEQWVAFDWYRGYSIETAWDELLKKMEKDFREKEAQMVPKNQTYYARLNETSLSQWAQDKKRLESLKFIKDLLLQGAYQDQMLISFTYDGNPDELSDKWRQAGWQWSADFIGKSGTLTKGVIYE